MFLTRIFTNFYRMNTNKGQAVYEYAIIIGLVALALSVMQVYLKRGIQSGIKLATDEIGLQEDSVEIDPTKGEIDPGRGFLEKSEVNTRSTANNRTDYRLDGVQSRGSNERDAVTYGESVYISNWEEQ